MRTKYDVTYERIDTMPRDTADQVTGRALTQQEVRLREHIFDLARTPHAGTLHPMEDKMHELYQQGCTGSDQDKNPAAKMYDIFDDYRLAKDSVALDGIKLGYLTGQRDGLRLGIGIAMQVLTTWPTGGAFEPKIPSTGELLGVLLAMTDDHAADSLILKAMGAKPDTGDQTDE